LSVVIVKQRVYETLQREQNGEHKNDHLLKAVYSPHVSFRHHTHYSGDSLHIPHIFSLKSIGEIETQCGNDMVSLSCN